MPEAPAPAASPTARHFDPAAAAAWLRRPLAEAPWLHAEVARRMSERLSIMKMQPGRVTDWWAERGASTALLQQRYPKARLTCIEPTAALARVSAARRRTAWWSPARWTGASPTVRLEAEAEAGGADLLWANMVLHWVQDPAVLMGRWRRALAVDGFVMFSCLGPDTLRELRALQAARGQGPVGAEFVDMHDLGDMMVQEGFADPVMDMECLTLTWPSGARFLAELRTLGCNTHPARFAGLRTRRWRDALEASLDARERPLSMSFEVIYGHALKGVPRAGADGRTEVSLADMRAMVRRRPGEGSRT